MFARNNAPKTLTEVEQAALLKVTDSTDAARDHILFSVALGTGLRESELVALNVGDVTNPRTGRATRRVVLSVYKRSSKGEETGVPQEVMLPDALVRKLNRFLGWKAARGESVEPEAPLFISRKRNRLSTRSVRELFVKWQEAAGFEKRHTFHALRHTACSNLYRKTLDIRLVQRFARHAHITTTQIYTKPSDEDLLLAVRDLSC